MRVVIFTSPKAGSGAGRNQLPRLSDSLTRLKIDTVTVNSVADAQSAIADAAQAIVVAAGGDGTLALIAGSIDRNVPIVPMPMGTENLLARYFGHRADAKDVEETIRHGRTMSLDMGVANGKPFLIMATCGFDAEVVRGMHLTRRGHISRLSYLKPIARALRHYRFPALRVSVDGGDSFEAGWAMVFNLPSYAASLAIEPDAIADDGLLDVIAFKGRSTFSSFRYLAGIKFGRHLAFPDTIRLRGRSIEVSAVDSSRQRISFQTDGDYAGRLPLQITTMPARVQLLLPPLYAVYPLGSDLIKMPSRSFAN